MKLTASEKKALLEAAKPLLRWVNENCHPHCRVVVDQVTVELVESTVSRKTLEFVRD